MKPLQMFLLAADKLVRCRWDGRSDQLEIVNTALEGETLREVARDSANPQHLYAATLTEIHVSEDGGENWKWLPAGGIDFRDIWTMAVHPTRSNEIYVGTLPAAVYVSENGGRSFHELSAFRRLPSRLRAGRSSVSACMTSGRRRLRISPVSRSGSHHS